MTVLLSFATGLYVFLFLVAVLPLAAKDRGIMERRLKDFVADTTQTTDQPSRRNKVRRQRLPVSQTLANDLVTAGIKMRPEEFLVAWGLAVILPVALFVLFDANPITILAVALIAIAMPLWWMRQKKAKRLIRFETQLGDALVMAANGLRSGLTFQQAMNNIAKEMPDPIGLEFSRAIREINLGASVETALGNLSQRINSQDLGLAVSAIQIQRQVGGNLLELLENIAETIQDRNRVKNDIRVMTASGRSSGLIIGVLPIAIGGILMLINPGYIESFFETQLGMTMLIIGIVMETIGFLAINKIVTIKY